MTPSSITSSLYAHTKYFPPPPLQLRLIPHSSFLPIRGILQDIQLPRLSPVSTTRTPSARIPHHFLQRNRRQYPSPPWRSQQTPSVLWINLNSQTLTSITMSRNFSSR